MIESRLDEATDGTGGGYGKYSGLTVAEVAERFRFLVSEGQGRSARAILRIVHEQTEARGNLGTQRLLVALGVVATVVIFLFRMVVVPETRERLTAPLEAATGMTVLFMIGAASVHRATVRGAAQVREIRRLALIALDGLVSSPGFEPKSLEREHIAALQSLKKSDREAWDRVTRALKVGSLGNGAA